MTPSYSSNIFKRESPEKEGEIRQVQAQPFEADEEPVEFVSIQHAIRVHRNGVTSGRNEHDKNEVDSEDQEDETPAEPEISPVEAARIEAEKILDDARRLAEQMAEEAYREGFAQGERAGMELGTQKTDPIIKSLDSLAQGLTQAHEALVQQMEGELIKVAFAIATRLLHKELTLHPETVVAVAREAIKRTVTGGKITLRVNPLDIEYLQTSGSILPEFSNYSEDLTLKADYDVLRGGVIVETDSGQIDTTLDTQLSILWNALIGQEDDADMTTSDISGFETPPPSSSAGPVES